MLVHALIREDGTVGADELYTVANILGISDPVHQTPRAEGRFTHQGRGRKAELRATANTTRALAPNADFLGHAFQQDAGLAPWDGVWHLASFAAPESACTAQDSLRETLVHLGGAPLQGGLYVCTNTWEPYVEEAAHRLGAHSALTLLTTTDLRRGATPKSLPNSPAACGPCRRSPTATTASAASPGLATRGSPDRTDSLHPRCRRRSAAAARGAVAGRRRGRRVPGAVSPVTLLTGRDI